MASASRACVRCGKAFEAVRATRKYCGSSCRGLASTERAAVDPVSEPQSSGFVPGPLVTQTLTELIAAGEGQSARGIAVLSLAARIEAARGDTGSAFAALVREYEAQLARVTAAKQSASSPLDELRRKREARAG